MEKIIIWGAGNTGKSAYYCLRNVYECLFFIDSDKSKWGGYFENLQIKSPEALREFKDIKVVVASIYCEEILKTIKQLDCHNIMLYKAVTEDFMTEDTMAEDIGKELDTRSINLGAFLKSRDELCCKELTFMPGGSLVLDHMFLKAIAETFKCRTYLEIGTYIGESINVLTDCCDSLYSITADPKSPYSSGEQLCKPLNLPDYSERLTYSEKIQHFYADSKTFDFTKVKEEIDLFFIDGDHSYEGVYADTKNVFNIKKDNAIVIWHDFRSMGFQYNKDIVCAVKDALGNEFSNVYVTDRNLCGIYLPEDIKSNFSLKTLQYEKGAELYTYDVVLRNCGIR